MKDQHVVYKTKNVCSKGIQFDIVNDRLHNVEFDGGCAGNTVGVAHLLEGMTVEEALRRVEGIPCGPKKTSCPDQLAKAIRERMAAE